MEDPDVDVLPLRLAYRVLRRVDAKLAADGSAGDVAEIAPVAFRPCALQGSGRNRDLVTARAHDHVELDRTPSPDGVSRRSVIERGKNQRARRESARSPIPRARQLALPIIADRGQTSAKRKECAVLRNGLRHSGVAETARREPRVEHESNGVSWQKRLLERVYPVAEVVVCNDASGRPIEGDVTDSHARTCCQVNRVDRHRARVDEMIRAANAHLP